MANTTEFRIGSITIKNIAGYRSVKGQNTEDYDGLPLPLLPIERLTDDHNFSEELQILGGSEQLSWIIGAYYFTESISEENGSYSLAPISVNRQSRAAERSLVVDRIRCGEHQLFAVRASLISARRARQNDARSAEHEGHS